MNENLLQVQDGFKQFNSKTILKKINLEIRRGDFVALIGPSGTGKTTLLRLLAGLETWSTSSFVEQKNSSTSFVFQEPNLLSWRTLLENIQLPLEIQKKPINQEHLNKSLEAVHLEGAGTLFPHELSGGMKMRASLARALITEPELLFMDEPFSALDEPTREDLQDQLRKIWEARANTIVFVTHSLSEALFLANRIIFLSGKPASIFEDYKPNLPKQRDRETRSSEIFFRELSTIRNLFQKTKEIG
ncbi:MAG: hypothetical protein RJB66_964 [Pseudomonadota bacterium]|jgi:NitT/TauT family transport system ATP-binding protein